MAQLVAGVDEAGRGPLAGPVVAAAVILPRGHGLVLADSKRLREPRRTELAARIRRRALACATALAATAEIETLGIHGATLLAMARALEALSLAPDRALIDGLFVPRMSCEGRAIVRGDATVPVISAASILAKVTRDAMMVELDRRYPEYGFRRHKGYPTQAHLEALRTYGPCPEHRRGFAPVARLLEGEP